MPRRARGKWASGNFRVELGKLLVDRRRAWFKCEPKMRLNRQEGTAEITFTIDQPRPNGIAENTVLYAFAEANVQKKGRYLGEFRATKSDPKHEASGPGADFAVRPAPWTACRRPGPGNFTR